MLFEKLAGHYDPLLERVDPPVFAIKGGVEGGRQC